MPMSDFLVTRNGYGVHWPTESLAVFGSYQKKDSRPQTKDTQLGTLATERGGGVSGRTLSSSLGPNATGKLRSDLTDHRGVAIWS